MKQELDLLKLIHSYPSIIESAGKAYDPSIIANFSYALAKAYHKFWHDCPIFSEESKGLQEFRLHLSEMCGKVLKSSMDLLGIQMPDRM